MANDDYNPGGDWFVDAPSGDQPLDQLFPDPNGDGTQPNPAASQPPQTQDQFFLRTPTGTVYKTADDAVTGIVHKDNLIEQLRQYAIERTGFDPVAKKQVRQPEPPQATSSVPDPGQPVNYSSAPKRYWDDLVNAARTGDADAYVRIQAQLVNEQLAPYAPLIARVGKDNAVNQVSSQFPEFRKFYDSDQYRTTLDAIPRLGDAIKMAESNPQMANQLEDLYKMAYLANQGLRLSEAPAQQPPVVAQPAAPEAFRPTMTPNYIPPPTPQATPQYDPRTREGRSQARQQTIREQEARGVLDLKF